MNTLSSRRQFLRKSAFGVAAAPALFAVGAPPSERVRLAFIACGGRARQMMPIFHSFEDVEIVAVSDVFEPRMRQAIQLFSRGPRPQKPEAVADYRRVLERRDVDAVVIATTQHWHGLPHIHACQAGKAIFVEKPLSHTVAEGRVMVNATKKHGVLAMMGTQQRAGPHYQQAVKIVQSGRLGKIALVECWNYHNTGARVGRPADEPVPAGLDWDRWLGPAPIVPYNPGRLNNSWWFDYAGGMMTNWAIHHLDIILWAMRALHPRVVDCAGGKYVVNDIADTPDTIEASWDFGDWLMQYHYRGFNNFHFIQSRPNHHGIAFHGNKATLVLDRFGYEIWNDNNPKEVTEKERGIPYFVSEEPTRSEQDGRWHRLFINCVKEGKQPPLDLEESHRGTVCCHLANIAYRVRRRVAWDGAKETISADAEAARLLSRPRRNGYELPGYPNS